MAMFFSRDRIRFCLCYGTDFKMIIHESVDLKGIVC